MHKLKCSDINIGIDGQRWIFASRQKTETPFRIPLLPVPLLIIERYKEHPQCACQGRLLPVWSTQQLNEYLKEIADVCGITKRLTYHMARHTFATTITLNNGSWLKVLGFTILGFFSFFFSFFSKGLGLDFRVVFWLSITNSTGFLRAAAFVLLFVPEFEMIGFLFLRLFEVGYCSL